MQAVIDFATGLGAWNWFVLAAVLILLETIIPGVHFMWFGTAAVLLGALALLVPITLSLQLVLYGIVALSTILAVRQWWAPGQLSKSDVPDLNDRGHQYIGRTLTVVEAIRNGRGRVQVGDTVWTAEGPETPAGALVTVKGVNGTALVVARA